MRKPFGHSTKNEWADGLHSPPKRGGTSYQVAGLAIRAQAYFESHAAIQVRCLNARRHISDIYC